MTGVRDLLGTKVVVVIDDDDNEEDIVVVFVGHGKKALP